ncbi:hypothetical protein [Scardovia wiggsiae]|uniref:hypothetical protein n=1 Tax=Scardovia wiggsiae TaxID=230143 RepID=UPI003BAA11DF
MDKLHRSTAIASPSRSMSSVSRGLRTVTGKVAKSRWQQHDPMDAAAADRRD